MTIYNNFAAGTFGRDSEAQSLSAEMLEATAAKFKNEMDNVEQGTSKVAISKLKKTQEAEIKSLLGKGKYSPKKSELKDMGLQQLRNYRLLLSTSLTCLNGFTRCTDSAKKIINSEQKNIEKALADVTERITAKETESIEKEKEEGMQAVAKQKAIVEEKTRAEAQAKAKAEARGKAIEKEKSGRAVERLFTQEEERREAIDRVQQGRDVEHLSEELDYLVGSIKIAPEASEVEILGAIRTGIREAATEYKDMGPKQPKESSFKLALKQAILNQLSSTAFNNAAFREVIDRVFNREFDRNK